VDPHVSIEIPGLRETELAKLALVRLFARVNPKMLRQSAGVGKGFLTQATSENEQKLN
jgi:hypothetical protein